MKKTLLFIGVLGSFFCKAQDYDWTIYNTSNSPLQCNEVAALAVDHDSSIWLGACDVIYKFKNGNWTIYDAAVIGYTFSRVNQIAVDNNNTKWFGTLGGLLRYDGNNWTVYNITNSGIPDDYITALAVDTNNLLWFASPDVSGLYTFDEISFNVYNQDSSDFLYMATANRIDIDSENNKFFAALGLYKYDNVEWSWELIYYDFNNQVGSVRSVDIRNNDDRWLSLDFMVRVYRPGVPGFTEYNQTNIGIPIHGVNRIAFDSIGNIWVGGASERLIRFDGINWFEYTPSNSAFPVDLGGIAGADISDIVVNINNTIYVATIQAGLIQLEASPINVIEKEDVIFEIYPNPAHEFIKLTNLKSDASIEIFDVNGTALNSIQYRTGDNIIPIGDLANGVYYLKIKDKDRVMYKMFIKN